MFFLLLADSLGVSKFKPKLIETWLRFPFMLVYYLFTFRSSDVCQKVSKFSFAHQ